jgi:hypothetical protein
MLKYLALSAGGRLQPAAVIAAWNSCSIWPKLIAPRFRQCNQYPKLALCVLTEHRISAGILP